MKDKEIIEEIETIIKSNLAEGSFANAFARKVAIQIVEHCQPKLLEDSIVISREEYEHLKAKSTRIPIDKDGNFIEYAVYDTDKVLSKPEYREYVYKQASKETAEKLYNTIVYRILALNFETNNKDYDEGFFDAQKEILRRIDAAVKECGVEIKEQS